MEDLDRMIDTLRILETIEQPRVRGEKNQTNNFFIQIIFRTFVM